MSGSGPSLYPGELPPLSVFKFPPDPAPQAIPPPFEESTFRTPFPIRSDIYNGALDVKVPLTIASVYATTVVLVNWWNRKNGNKPWAIAKTRAFKAFVIFHNVFLAVYSAVTCVAMVRALKHSIPHYTEHNAFVGTVDALCKINGPRGLGDAATFSNADNRWSVKNPLIKLGFNDLPDTADVGRIWNEGLAFWGWIFYLSKFYEVLDTAIILAKGKRSTTLQTYHHAGAMLSMWAGMRYMSPPIWMFALVNSGIHAMMYTYYTLSALGIRVPATVKRTLTSLQILQFLVGATFAGLHLFVSYTVPVATPYSVMETVASSLSAAPSAAASVVNNAAAATATGAAVAFLKKMVYRAAGEEGLAENVGYTAGAPVQQPHGYAQKPRTSERTLYRTEYQHVPCIDTSGQAFAIYLNLIYLAPLTGLFMRFFVKSYLRRTSANTKHTTKRRSFSKSARDAIHGIDREIESLGRSAEDSVGSGVERIAGSVRGRTSASNPPRNGSLSPANQKFVDSLKAKVDQRLAEEDSAKEKTKSKVDGQTNGSADAKPKDEPVSYAQAIKEESDEKDGSESPSSPSTPSGKKNKKNKNGGGGNTNSPSRRRG